MRRACKLIGVEIELHRPPCPPPVLMVADHISWLDIPAICAASPGVFVAEAEVSRWPEDPVPQRA
jgi:1-acyl-sn-glycerol-3-phosphate acyltransferase